MLTLRDFACFFSHGWAQSARFSSFDSVNQLAWLIENKSINKHADRVRIIRSRPAILFESFRIYNSSMSVSVRLARAQSSLFWKTDSARGTQTPSLVSPLYPHQQLNSTESSQSTSYAVQSHSSAYRWFLLNVKHRPFHFFIYSSMPALLIFLPSVIRIHLRVRWKLQQYAV